MSSVTCADLRDAFLEGKPPAGPDVERHIAECAACRELVAAPVLGIALSAQARSLPRVDSTLEARLAESLERERGVRAWLRALPTPARVGLALLGAAAIVAVQALLRKTPAGATLVLPLALTLLFTTLGLLSTARPRTTFQSRGLIVLGLSLPALLWCVEAAGAEASPAGNALVCFAYGAAFSLPLGLLLVMLERRERVPAADAALLGVSLGLFAAIVLDLECASTHLPHLLAGHASVGWVFGALLVGWAELRSRRPL